MLDDKDIQKLIEVFATRAEVASKEDLLALRTELEDKMNDILTVMDAYMQKADSYMQESVITGHQLNRHERWIEELAAKAGHKLKA